MKIDQSSKEEDALTTFIEVVESQEEEKWRIAIKKEMHSLHKNQTWRLTSLPIGNNAIGYKWIFEKKERISSQEDVCYKVWLVAKGYAKEGIDYNKVFSPTVKLSFIIILLNL